MKTHHNGKNGSAVARIMLTLVGLGLVGFGALSLKNGVWVYWTFSQRFGRPTVIFAAQWIGLGVVFFLSGAIPWSKWLERWNRRRR